VSVNCDFSVHLRIIGSDGATVRGDLNDQAAGLALRRGIQKPGGELLWERYTSPRSVGDFTIGAPRPAADDLIVRCLVWGSSWVEVNTRWQTALGWLEAELHFFVELEEDGVVTRWRTDRPPVSPVSYDRLNRQMVHEVRFHVQPNPSIDFVV
jgi:hypothetical protein